FFNLNVLFTAKQSSAKRTFSSDSVRTSCDELRGNAEAKNLKPSPSLFANAKSLVLSLSLLHLKS
ncbi:hypothetical protein ACWA77_001851, partial [Campylobacter upsaliensis]